ncbi:MAG: SDR family oxidoreductase [Acidobacteria bacterium]|nr:SDR family oxidoreductase [Acidobacteriota bacterium]
MLSGDLFSLAEQSVLITGGGQGLGRTMALGLAASGANVAIIDINKETAESAAQEIESLGVRSLAIHGDITKEEDAKRAVSKVVDSWGRLDVLFNNAGFALLGAAEDTAVADFKRVYELDVFGMFICSKAAFGPMVQQRRGSIINIASMCGLTVVVPQKHAGYNSAKAAVIMLTKSLAVEWAQHGIRVNAIAPGYMITPPVVKLQQEDPERWKFWMSRVPMGRAGEPVELQGAAVFLAGKASSYMTGSVLVIDGGYTCL